MIVDIPGADGEPVSVDLYDVKTIEPEGSLTALVLADGSRVLISNEAVYSGFTSKN